MIDDTQTHAISHPPRTRWFWAPLALVGIALVLYGGYRGMLIIGCTHWPTTTGTITRSALHRGMLREGVAAPSAALTYEYRVNDRILIGHQLSFSRKWGPYADAYAVIRHYRENTPVTVHFDPKAPDRSVLDVRISWRGFQPLIFGLVLTPLAIMGYRRRWPLQSERLMDGPTGRDPLTRTQKVLGALGLVVVVSLGLLWWELIKLYAGVK